VYQRREYVYATHTFSNEQGACLRFFGPSDTSYDIHNTFVSQVTVVVDDAWQWFRQWDKLYFVVSSRNFKSTLLNPTAAAAVLTGADIRPRVPELSVRDICTLTRSRWRGRSSRNPAAVQFIF